MSSNLDANLSAEDPSEPFVSSYFIGDGKANEYKFQPPVKRQTREPAPSPCYKKFLCSWSEKQCCCCKCSWKCCGISTVIVIVLIGLVLAGGYLYFRSRLTGTASSEDKEKWEERLRDTGDGGNLTISNLKLSKSILDGEYLLVSYEKNYPDYLASLDIPSFVISLILSSSEKSTIKQPAEPTGNWTIHTKTDLKDRDTIFRIGEVFSLEFNMGSQKGLMVANCSLSGPAQNILSCDSEEKTKKIKFKTESIFTKAGFIETRTNLNKKISTKKYFQRLSELEMDIEETKVYQDKIDDDIDELNNRIASAPESSKNQEKLFSDDDADSDEWDNKFFNDDQK